MTVQSDIARALGKPFPPSVIKQRQGGGGKSLSYVETHVVIHRLNNSTGNCWDFKLTRLDQVGDLYVAVGELTIPGLGTRTGIGVQRVVERSGEDLVKGAASDCLKKCATLFGVGLELYGPDYEAGEIAAAPANGKPAAEFVRPAPTSERAPSLYRPRSGSGPTDAQRNFMNGLAKQLGWTIVGPDSGEHHDEAQMNTEIALLYPGKTIDALTTAEASAVIEQWQKIQADRRARLGIK